MRCVPKTCIQIHYHNGTGGVTRVMQQYAASFSRITNASANHNIIVCNDRCGTIKLDNRVKIFNIKGCDYHLFRSIQTFYHEKERLYGILRHIITNSDLSDPILIIGHNLSIGKNIALSAAFSQLGLYYSKNDSKTFRKIYFYSVIHDLVEEGRWELLRKVRSVESLGIPVWAYLYPWFSGLRYVVLNKRNYQLFQWAHFPVSLLPNALEEPKFPPLLPHEHAIVAKGLGKLARVDGLNYCREKKNIFYPTRVIARKNVFEALLIVCAVYDANLIIGSCGNSRCDKEIFKYVKRLGQRYHLGLVVDGQRIAQYVPSKLLTDRNPFELLYRYADTSISTSVAEGFGYALYEPWLFGVPVIGRLPQGIAVNEIVPMQHLYNYLPIPVSWINLDTIADYYIKKYSQSHRITMPMKKIKSEITTTAPSNDIYIDFGLLDYRTQYAIVTMILSRHCPITPEIHHVKKRWRTLVPEIKRSYKNRDSKIQHYATSIKNTLIGNAFDEKFKKVFCRDKPAVQAEKHDRNLLMNYFTRPQRSKLIMG